MLTKEAFNALLKTLEEPPEHVVFILATTEEEKLLDTILSRCQVFRMRAPSRTVLAETVADVAKSEGFTLNQDAADLIAVAADGSFRDALGVTQKVILASGDTIGDADEVAAIIGAPKTAVITDLVTALANKDASSALAAVDQVVGAHVDMKLCMRLLLERVRAIILLRNAPAQEESLLSRFGESEAEHIKSLATAEGTSLNSHTLTRLLTAAQDVNRVAIAQLPLEIAIIDLTSK